MVYAYPLDRTFVTSKNVNKRAVLSDEIRARRDYMSSHKISIHRDKNSNELIAEVIEKRQIH